MKRRNRHIFKWLLLLMAISGNTFVTCAANYYVNDNSTTGDVYCTAVGNNSNNGTSAATPKLTLANLLSTYAGTLTSGDNIYIDAGTYSDKNITMTTAGLNFIGAGATLTIFDNNFASSNSNYFMIIDASNVTLQDMKLMRYNSQASVTKGIALTIGDGATSISGVSIQNVDLDNNNGADGSWAVAVLGSATATINGGGYYCNNSATDAGGIEVDGTSVHLLIEHVLMGYNDNTNFSNGGALYLSANCNSTTQVVLKHCRIKANNAINGGGIDMDNGNLAVYDCIIDGNASGATSSSNYGAGINVAGGTAWVSRSQIINNVGQNSTTQHGGGIAAYSSNAAVTLTVDSCYFSGNTSSSSYGSDIFAQENFSRAVTVSCDNNTFSSGGTNLYQASSASLSITNCGTPASSGTITTIDNNPPTYNAAPTAPTYSGTCGAGTITVLPIELADFKGQYNCDQQDVELLWQTASETNNDFFTIERSMNGLNYTPIATIKGAGTSKTLLTYTYNDDQALEVNATAYYRLSQTDFDGRKVSYGPIAVTRNCRAADGDAMQVFPNPSVDDITVMLPLYEAGEVKIMIYNALGRQLRTRSEYMDKGTGKVTMSVADLPPACYFVKVITGTQSYSRPFLKTLR